MNSLIRFSILLLACALSSASVFSSQTAQEIYQVNCSSCHGAKLGGGLGSSLVDDEWTHGGSPEAIAKSIAKGFPSSGMPAWEKTLSDKEIRSLVIFIKEQKKELNKEKVGQRLEAKNGIFEAAGHKFTIKRVAEISEGVPWALDFLPDASVLITQRNGILWHIKDGKKLKIKNTPEVWEHHQGGLFDVAVHPEYEKNGWIYLSYSEHAGVKENGEKAGTTSIVRGKIKKGEWVEQEGIFSADKSFHTANGRHFGSRIVFQEGYVYFSIGDRGEQDLAQNLERINGKIYRLHDDGRVPKDNPFLPSESPITSAVWSYGHRNQQGLAFHPITGDLWEAEHGPRGGDEINLIEPGLNYGWPIITYGMNYNGTPITATTHKEGMEQPKHYWVPSIAVSAIDFYQGKAFKKWNNKLLVASLRAEELHLLTIENQGVVSDDIVLINQGRIRDVVSGPDGAIYLWLNDGKNSLIKMEATN